MKKALIVSCLVLTTSFCFADVNTGGLASAITAATTELKSNFKPITTFLYVIAAIVGVYGAVRVYTKHQNGDQDTNKSMGIWLFSFVFLLGASLIIQAFFSV